MRICSWALTSFMDLSAGLLLYHSDVRFRREQLPRNRRREHELLGKAISKSYTTGFDPENPWEYLFELVSREETPDESIWRQQNFERYALIANAGVTPVGNFIGGDTNIASAHSAHMASSTIGGKAFTVAAGVRIADIVAGAPQIPTVSS